MASTLIIQHHRFIHRSTGRPPKRRDKTDMPSPQKSRIAWSLWIPVILVFLIIILGWIVRINLAQENPIEMIEIKSR